MLEKWMEMAARGESVWLDEVSAECANNAECRAVVMELMLFSGARRAVTRHVPAWHTPRERLFVREYLAAAVYNMLSALGGSRLCFYYDTSDTALDEMIIELDSLFQLAAPPRAGYGKVINESERICALLGLGRFSFERRDISAYIPAPAEGQRSDGELPRRLRKCAARAEEMVCCGVDVGGTDIKLAVSVRGRLVCVKEYDWDPASFDCAQKLIAPILMLTRLMRACAAELIHFGAIGEALLSALDKAAPDARIVEAVNEAEARLGARCNVLDSVGLSYPDVVIRNAIGGGETPKTQGLRNNRALDYEAEFKKLSALNTLLEGLCREGGHVRMTNDGNVAAFSAAAELAHSDDEALISGGVVAYALGTELGVGWLDADGRIPELVLELYDTLSDLGSWPEREYDEQDLRCVRNENSGLAGARRYIGQAGVFRLAYALAPDMLDGFVEDHGGLLRIRTSPRDMRKPCLERLMTLAEDGRAEAEEVFRGVGRALAHVSREAELLLRPQTSLRFLFGRLVKHARCFELICEGFASVMPQLRLIAADDDLACSALMRQLAAMPTVTVAQFGQAIGAIYYGLT